jgi:hypothetical protein
MYVQCTVIGFLIKVWDEIDMSSYQLAVDNYRKERRTLVTDVKFNGKFTSGVEWHGQLIDFRLSWSKFWN